jgi:HSP20 family protein
MLWDIDIFSEMERLRREMNGLFSNYGQSSGSATYPLMNVYDDKDNIIVTAELPGLVKDQVEITFSDGILTVSGKQQPLAKTKNMSVVRKERPEGNFEKTVRLPTQIKQDAIKASFSNGILTINMPKAEEVKPKTIAIEAK